MPDECPVLISSAGRRVSLLRAFRAAQRAARVSGPIIVTDVSASSSAFHSADVSRLMPPCRSDEFIPATMALCDEYGVRLVVPTIDTELSAYATHRQAFSRRGILVNISSLETIKITSDKRLAHIFFTGLPVASAKQACMEDALLSSCQWKYPIIAKPAQGSSGTGVYKVESYDDLKKLAHLQDYIVESYVIGNEVTVDVFLVDGKCLQAVPRRRIEVRGGEVSKGVTMRHESILRVSTRVAEALPGAFGALNLQIFHDPSTESIVVSEVNARFGGGVPLSIAAGAPMPQWLVELALNRPPTISPSWINNLVMLRYDDAVFVTGEQAGLT